MKTDLMTEENGRLWPGFKAFNDHRFICQFLQIFREKIYSYELTSGKGCKSMTHRIYDPDLLGLDLNKKIA